jgi:hypothetical protein
LLDFLYCTLLGVPMTAPCTDPATYLSVSDVLKLLPIRIARSTFYKWLREGRFGRPHRVHDRGRLFFAPDDVNAFLETLTR